MVGSTSAAAMAKRVFISALFGILIGAIFVNPVVTVVYQRDWAMSHGQSPGEPLGAFLIYAFQAPGIALLDLVIASPLIGIAVLTGILLRMRIDSHPLFWSCVAPFAVWLFTCSIFALDQDPPWGRQRDFLERLLGEVWKVDNSLFFFAPAAAAVLFAFLTRRATRAGK